MLTATKKKRAIQVEWNLDQLGTSSNFTEDDDADRNWPEKETSSIILHCLDVQDCVIYVLDKGTFLSVK